MENRTLIENNIHNLLEAYHRTMRLIKTHCAPYVVDAVEVVSVDSPAYRRGFSYKAWLNYPHQNTKVFVRVDKGELLFFATTSVDDDDFPDSIHCFDDVAEAIQRLIDEEKVGRAAAEILEELEAIYKQSYL